MKKLLLSVLLCAAVVSTANPMKRKNVLKKQQNQAQEQVIVDFTSMVQTCPDALRIIASDCDGLSYSALPSVCKRFKLICDQVSTIFFKHINFADAACHGNESLTRRYLTEYSNSAYSNKLFEVSEGKELLVKNLENDEVLRVIHHQCGNQTIVSLVSSNDEFKNECVYLWSFSKENSQLAAMFCLASQKGFPKTREMFGEILRNIQQDDDIARNNVLNPLGLNLVYTLGGPGYKPVGVASPFDYVQEHAPQDTLVTGFRPEHGLGSGYLNFASTQAEKNLFQARFEYLGINITFILAAQKNHGVVIDILLSNPAVLGSLSTATLTIASQMTTDPEIARKITSVLEQRQ